MPKKPTGTVEPVTAGETVSLLRAGRPATEDVVVQLSCHGKAGHWYCVTHRKHFTNNFAKDSHIATGKHRLAWACHECDQLEEP